MKKYRLAILTSHPIQYQAPIWRALAADPRLDIEVYFGTDMSLLGYRDPQFGTFFKWDVPLLDGYRHRFLSSSPIVTFFRPFCRA